MQNQSAKIATKVPNGIAAEEPSPQRMRFMIKKSANTILKNRAHLEHRNTSEHSVTLTKQWHCFEILAQISAKTK